MIQYFTLNARRRFHSGLLSVLFLIFAQWGLAQCPAPIAMQPDNIYADSAHLVWLPNNAEPGVIFDLEIRQLNIPFSSNPTIFAIATPGFMVQGLLSGTAYHYRVRSRCPNGSTSSWSNAQTFYTHLPNPGLCNSSLPIQFSGTNCANYNKFYIDVNNAPGDSLGANVFLKEIKLVIKHSFPADLRISLISPSGDTILLSANNGATTDNLGDPNSNCTVTAIFSDQACQQVSESNIPLRGLLLPQEPINYLNNLSNPNGSWTLLICDDQVEDGGTLEFAELVFDTQLDIPPSNICVSEISSTTARINYSFNSNCQILAVQYGTIVPNQTLFVPCFLQTLVIPGLDPGTTYNGVFRVSPGSGRTDVYSCPFSFTTTCLPITRRTSFDTTQLCNTVCGAPCQINGFWFNNPGSPSTWQVLPSKLLHVNRAIFSDVSGCGNFVAIQKNPACPSPKNATLQSPCLQIVNTGSNCHFRFNYFSAGRRDKTIKVEYTANEGNSWSTIENITTKSSQDWQLVNVELPAAVGMNQFKLRIVGLIPDGNEEFLALDEIIIMNSVSIVDGTTYYRDLDHDNFGDDEETIVICSASVPNGYVVNGGDCNDMDGSVYPGATEIKCNLIDENCNGMADDLEGSLAYTVTEVQQLTCTGTKDGMITINVANAVGAVLVTWSNGDTTSTIDSLPDGIYTATISDESCQIITEPILITGQPGFVVTTTSQDAFCEGNPSGSITSFVTGANGPFGFYWSNGSQEQNPEDLVPGFYVATVLDTRGCMVLTTPVYVGFVPNFNINTVVHPVSCPGGNDGTIILEGVDVGSTVVWSNGSMGTQLENLISGQYRVTITNPSGCVRLDTFTILQPASINLHVVDILPVSCAGFSDGILNTQVTGGSPPYQFKWSNGATTQGLINVPGDTYRVTVTDANSCLKVFLDLVVPEPSPIIAVVDTLHPNTCLLGNRGAVGIAISGGSGIYQAVWSNGEVGTFIDSLASGFYTVVISDDSGCKATNTNIEVPSLNIPLNLNLVNKVDLSCFGDSKGKIVVNVPDGQIPITFLWSNGAKNINNVTFDSISNLPKGKYTVTATDANGCVVGSDTFSILQPAEAINFSDLLIDSTRCSYSADGGIDLFIFGGSTPYQYMWSNGAVTSTLVDVAAGFYALTITDNAGCKRFFGPWKVSAPLELTFNANIVAPTIGQTNGSITLVPSGGVGASTTVWNQGQTTSAIFNLGPGTYCATITDKLNCENDTCIILNYSTGTANPLEALIRIYPNPASNDLSVELGGLNVENVKLLDIYGRAQLIGIEQSGTDHIRLNLQQVPSGWYVVALCSDGGDCYYRNVLINR